MHYIIRKETEADFAAAENVTREAFWNVYRPGCAEHYILHKFRNDPGFVAELSYVAEIRGKVVGHIMYSRGTVLTDEGNDMETAVFGPVSVLPKYQGRGIGGALISFTMEKARRLGFKAVIITGEPRYYGKFGFVKSSDKGIYYGEAPRGEDFEFLLVKELEEGFFDGVAGVYHEPEGYEFSEDALEAFDRRFPHKEKLRLPGQLE